MHRAVSDTPKGLRIVEVCVVLAICIGYVIFHRELEFNLWFIGPMLLLIVGYLVYVALFDQRSLKDFGLRKDNLPEAIKLNAMVFGPIMAGSFIYAAINGTPNLWVVGVVHGVFGAFAYYVYCLNDPVNKVDVLGLKDIDFVGLWNSTKNNLGRAKDWYLNAWASTDSHNIFQADLWSFYVGEPLEHAFSGRILRQPMEAANRYVRDVVAEQSEIGSVATAQMRSLGFFSGAAGFGIDVWDYATPDALMPTVAQWHANLDGFTSGIDSIHFSTGHFFGYEAPLIFLAPEMFMGDAARAARYSIQSDIVDWTIIDRGRALDEAERLYQLRLMKNRLALEYGQQSTLADSLYGATSLSDDYRFVAMARRWPSEISPRPISARRWESLGCDCYEDAVLLQKSLGGEIVEFNNMIPPVGKLEKLALPMNDFPAGGRITRPWFDHRAVVLDGVVYDRLTGIDGMPLETYLRRIFEYPEVISITPIK